MKRIKTDFFEKIFYNNKFLFVLSLILSIALWATVKINYSENTTRTITEVKATIDSTLASENDFVPFVEKGGLNVDVEVSGKSYNINSLKKDDIIVEASSGYIDSAGYKVLTFSARSSETGVDITSVNPSSVTVFFDRKANDAFNVEAKIKNTEALESTDGYFVGKPVPSLNTVNVSGPASVIENLKKVSFVAKVDNELLPLTQTIDVPATISYETDSKRGKEFLVCSDVGDKSNPATITIPVSKLKTVKTTVKFVGQPKYYDENPPRVVVDPAQVEISYNPADEEYDSYNVATIDFSKLQSGKNTFEFDVDEKNAASLVDKSIKTFKVTVDLGSVSETTIDASAANIVFLNQSKDHKYTASLKNMGLDSVTIIGPKKSLEKITADMLQIEINVSSLDTSLSGYQRVSISNISIRSEEINDCWVYGSYRAKVAVSEKK